MIGKRIKTVHNNGTAVVGTGVNHRSPSSTCPSSFSSRPGGGHTMTTRTTTTTTRWTLPGLVTIIIVQTLWILFHSQYSKEDCSSFLFGTSPASSSNSIPATTTTFVATEKKNDHHIHPTLDDNVNIDDPYSQSSSFYSLAYQQSFGFLDDIPNGEWQRLRQHVRDMGSNTCLELEREQNQNQNTDGTTVVDVDVDVDESCLYSKGPGEFFQTNYEPEFSCRHEARIGRIGDGGKWICDPHRLSNRNSNNKNNHAAAAKPCLVYSVGSNNDFSFEQQVFAKIGTHCEIHTFDPGNYGATAEQIRRGGDRSSSDMSNPLNWWWTSSTQPQKGQEPPILNLHYHQWGIDGRSWTSDVTGEEFLTLNETVHRLGHVGRTVDIFKIDCEGCELSSYPTWVRGLDTDDDGNDDDTTTKSRGRRRRDRSRTKQRGTFSSSSLQQRSPSPPKPPKIIRLQQVLMEIHSPLYRVHPQTHAFFQGMRRAGYVIFHKEPNIQYWSGVASAVEYSFLKVTPDFFL